MSCQATFQQYLPSLGLKILLKYWLIATLLPNKNCWKIYQGHVSSSVDAANTTLASIPRNETRQLTQAAIISSDRCVNTLGHISCKRSGRIRCHFSTNSRSFLKPKRWRTWKGENKKIKFPKYCGYYVASVKMSGQELRVKQVKSPDGMRDKTIYICRVWLCKKVLLASYFGWRSSKVWLTPLASRMQYFFLHYTLNNTFSPFRCLPSTHLCDSGHPGRPWDLREGLSSQNKQKLMRFIS